MVRMMIMANVAAQTAIASSRIVDLSARFCSDTRIHADLKTMALLTGKRRRSLISLADGRWLGWPTFDMTVDE